MIFISLLTIVVKLGSGYHETLFVLLFLLGDHKLKLHILAKKGFLVGELQKRRANPILYGDFKRVIWHIPIVGKAFGVKL